MTNYRGPWNAAGHRHRQTPRRYVPVGPVGEHQPIGEVNQPFLWNPETGERSARTCQLCGYHECSCLANRSVTLDKAISRAHALNAQSLSSGPPRFAQGPGLTCTTCGKATSYIVDGIGRCCGYDGAKVSGTRAADHLTPALKELLDESDRASKPDWSANQRGTASDTPEPACRMIEAANRREQRHGIPVRPEDDYWPPQQHDDVEERVVYARRAE